MLNKFWTIRFKMKPFTSEGISSNGFNYNGLINKEVLSSLKMSTKLIKKICFGDLWEGKGVTIK